MLRTRSVSSSIVRLHMLLTTCGGVQHRLSSPKRTFYSLINRTTTRRTLHAISGSRSILLRNALHHNSINRYQQCRGYVFLPSSFEEFIQNLKQLYNTTPEQRRIVLVKLLRDQYHEKSKRVSQRVSRLSQRTKRRRQQGKSLWRKRTANMRERTDEMRKRLLQQSSQWRQAIGGPRVLGARNQLKDIIKTRGIESLQRYQRRIRRYKTKAVTLQEYSQADWFDASGKPQTSRDEVTGRFVNPWNSVSTNGHHSFSLFLSWRLERLLLKTRNYFFNYNNNNVPALDDTKVETSAVPTMTTLSASDDSNEINGESSECSDKIKLTWMGHSTCLVEMGNHDIRILTDPHFSDYASPFRFFGPKRSVPAAKLPSQRVHVCCLSHDHYDHLDFDSICALRNVVEWWLVPLGFAEWLEVECNIDPLQIMEMQWWESMTFERDGDTLIPMKQEADSDGSFFKVTCAPAQHWCSRTPWDRNVRLWCSWAMEYSDKEQEPQRFYFGGDTGYPTHFPLFRQIGDWLGPFDLAAIPIGAYAPRWFMKDSHVNPREAVEIHKDLQSKKSVAIHWGTFDLADEDLQEPPVKLQKVLQEQDEDFVVLQHGESVESNPIVQSDVDSDLLDTDVADQSENDEEESSSEDDERQGVGVG